VQEGRAAVATPHAAAQAQELVDLRESCVDADDRSRPLSEQIVAKAAAPVHLDEQAAEVTQLIVPDAGERAALAA